MIRYNCHENIFKEHDMKKGLILYFSVYGTAKLVAEEIARQTNAELMEIEPVVPYDSDRNHYNSLARLAKREHDTDMRPQIKNRLPLEDYDTIFIGYPMWWYTFPMIIYTLFEAYDFSGKTIIPFNTHMGSGDGGTYKTIKELCPGANVLKGLPIEMSDAEGGAENAIKNWLENINYQVLT